MSGPDNKRRPLVGDERVILTIPKNEATEQRVTAKTTHAARGGEATPFIDIREHWFKDGPTSDPIPTRKGTMIHRNQVPRLVLALLREMKPDDMEVGMAMDIRSAAEALVD